jgi:hypothetical protein
MQRGGLNGSADNDDRGGSSASISSTVMVSVAVIWLDARGVTLDTENRFPFKVGSPGPSGGATPGGPLTWRASWFGCRLLALYCTYVARVLL